MVAFFNCFSIELGLSLLLSSLPVVMHNIEKASLAERETQRKKTSRKISCFSSRKLCMK